MTRFKCRGFNAVLAYDAENAARIFAGRMARQLFGRRGYMRTIRCDGWTESGRSHTFEAFVGTDDGEGGTVGRNVWVYVDRVEG